MDPATPSERLPDIEVQTLRGEQPFRLDELEGRQSSTCGRRGARRASASCRSSKRCTESVAGEVTFVGVNIGDDGDKAADYLDDLGITYDQYLDVGRRVDGGAEDGDVADDPDHRR